MKQSTGNEDKINSILRVWKERGDAGILALDGMCGAGKTTLAGLLSEKTGCPVVHMDDYYLPFSRRAENWREIKCNFLMPPIRRSTLPSPDPPREGERHKGSL